MRILGIDPGLGITGYAVLDYTGSGLPQIIDAGVVQGRSKKSLPERIHEIYTGVAEVIQLYHPESLSLEELYSFYKRPRTAILMGHARGAIMLAAANAGIPVVSYAATRIKRVMTGNGHANKLQMQQAVQTQFALDRLPEPPDVADAIAIAVCHVYLYRR